MKKTAIFISVLFLYSFCFSQSSKNLKQFIRGNIQDKISSIRNASQEENVSISLMALDFCLQNKAVLEDDRDLDALCLLSLLSLPYNYTDSLSQDEKAEFSEKILEIFNSFSDENVRIAVLNKISSGKLDSPSFVELLNSCLSDNFQNFSQDFYILKRRNNARSAETVAGIPIYIKMDNILGLKLLLFCACKFIA